MPCIRCWRLITSVCVDKESKRPVYFWRGHHYNGLYSCCPTTKWPCVNRSSLKSFKRQSIRTYRVTALTRPAGDIHGDQMTYIWVKSYANIELIDVKSLFEPMLAYLKWTDLKFQRNFNQITITSIQQIYWKLRLRNFCHFVLFLLNTMYMSLFTHINPYVAYSFLSNSKISASNVPLSIKICDYSSFGSWDLREGCIIHGMKRLSFLQKCINAYLVFYCQ